MNPALPNKYLIPDVEARQWHDGRLYIYGSQDILGSNGYCSNEYRVFSTDNLKDWVDHGISYRCEETLYAPDCIYKDGTYYLYYCTAGCGEFVATSKNPYGPFENPVEIRTANRDSIDPAIFIDDDGQAYFYWGQFSLRGGKLAEDMSTIIEDSIKKNIVNEREHGFHEGASIRKRNGIYYLIYTDISSHKATRLAYATSGNPLGPYTKRGIIIDNLGCDHSTWNNHGSIFEFNKQWYVAYHKAAFGKFTNRRFCIEPIAFDENGYIAQVEMTTNGAGEPIIATQAVDAYRISYIHGSAITKLNAEGMEVLSGFSQGNWIVYQYLDFTGDEKYFELAFDPAEDDFTVEVSTGWYLNARPLGELNIKSGECLANCSVKVEKGISRLYLIVKETKKAGTGLNLRNFKFQ